ncbi:MAG: hypothetical protein ACR2P2_14935 [Nakamurella sp.]
MSHHNLPQNIRELSLDDQALAADVVDLCCFERDRATGSLTVLICDSGGRMVQPVCIGQVPRRPAAADAGTLFAPLIGLAGELDGGLLVAVGKPAGPIDDDDRRWHQLAIDECRHGGVRLIGAYVATLSAVTRLPDPDQLPVG